MPRLDVSLDVAREQLAAAVPGLVLTHRLAEGMESSAFGGRLDGAPVAVRLNQDGAGFALDDFVARRFGATIPIPPVLVRGQLDGGIAYCVSELRPGPTLQDLDGDELTASVVPTRTVLAAIGAVVVDGGGAGPLQPGSTGTGTGTGTAASWREYVDATVSRDWSGLGAVDRALVERAAERVRCTPVPEARRLVHGDFGANNVLYHRGGISAVLDWDCAKIGDPLWDVANVAFWAPQLRCMAVLSEQLPNAPVDRWLAYQLAIGLDELAQARADGDQAEAAVMLSRIAALTGGGAAR